MIAPFDGPTKLLFAMVIAFLSIATAMSVALRRRSSNRPAMNNLVARVLSWWGMVALFALALLFGRAGAVALFTIIAMIATREIVSLRASREGEWLKGIAIALVVALPLVVFAIASRARGREMLIFLVVVTEMSDVLQYCWGKLFGTRKIVPRISPNKTWEGFLGGVLSATAIGAALRFLTPFDLARAMAIAFIVAIAGFIGGLLMSAIKRDAGVKDFGTLIPGHGGVMDRVDSLTLAAIAFYAVVKSWYT